MSNLNLKGIWIPIEILTDEKLSDKEKNSIYKYKYASISYVFAYRKSAIRVGRLLW